ncbi:MAG: succinate dehydrogenase assembly factor 2 [Mariprofundaceae bacterium]|nr:succinate dehydrogenase assembly factor 2 [Mariprofundaceae bacterium]
MDVRCLRYRLKRQGMLELDVWLSNLDDVLLSEDAALIAAVQMLLVCEAPVLLAMMHGDQAIPDILNVYLRKSL